MSLYRESLIPGTPESLMVKELREATAESRDDKLFTAVDKLCQTYASQRPVVYSVCEKAKAELMRVIHNAIDTSCDWTGDVCHPITEYMRATISPKA
jgi:hypothetical protein